MPVIRAAFSRTVRLVTTARLRQAVLAAIAPDSQTLAELAEIESATSTRLAAQAHGLEAVHAREFVWGVPHAAFINAAFAYAKPKQPNRFNDSRRGAWYAALDVKTCLAEVVFHMTAFLRDAGDFHATVQYAEMFASLAGEYADLREQSGHPALAADPALGYPAGNALADAVRAHGLYGIIYPSVRDPGGTCVVALIPHAVQSVAQGNVMQITWAGTPTPAITTIPEP